MAPMTSFIRWAGGKSWLIPYIQELTQGLEYNNYFEPFMGGASVFFAIQNGRKSYLSDLNEELINTFIEVRDEIDEVVEYMKTYKTDSDSYYKIRATEPTIPAERAARFLFLNATSFNGLYRVNKNGKYNVPYGRKNVSLNYDRLINASQKLANAELTCRDFDAIRPLIKEKDLIFLDPPYAVTKGENGFLGYNAKFFSLEDQYRLGELLEYINSIGAYFILTNAAHEKIKEIFIPHGRMVTLERNSLIGGKKAYRGKIQELIFTNIRERSLENGTD